MLCGAREVTNSPKSSKPNTIQFDSKASHPQRGLVVVYDLEGFSRFFNQPDVQEYVPGFINHVSAAISTCIYGGSHYWTTQAEQTAGLSNVPVQEKYLGDGAMYIWLETDKSSLGEEFAGNLCNRLWNLKTGFKKVLEAAADLLPVVDVPGRIRFGVAAGTIYE